MPGAVVMDDGGHVGSRVDQEKDLKANGVNCSSVDVARSAPEKETMTNAIDTQAAGDALQGVPRMNDLPDEIMHITQGFIPLSRLLTRLAQHTHNRLQEKVEELAKMAIPASAMNGNATSAAQQTDDTSNDNIRKKAALLTYVQDMHAKWVKALVIAEWSRKSDMVSKLIDLNFHIEGQRVLYDIALDEMAKLKRDLTFARMPSPDLKTALQVLSTGSAPWMPDIQYIEPPALTIDEQLKWINDLDTLLSLRLNLEEFDKIPPHFRNYEIDSGRVTFKVPGEFEVDLTIANEDFEKQFWFIDFRFDFKPAANSLSDSLRLYLEACVNDALSKDGLPGCYQFLHEFVLTCKINELKRQALHMSKTSWAGTVMVEQLHRALAIQYWSSRPASVGLKHWLLIAVSSGRKKNGRDDEKPSSHLVAKWYRENKEVEGAEITLDVESLSAETLLRTVVGMHIEYILRGIHNRLLEAPRFKNREAGMVLRLSKTDPASSLLATQVGFRSDISLSLEPVTGSFAIKPHSKFTVQSEAHLNNGRDPIADGVISLENVRCAFLEEKLNREGSSMGWQTTRPALNFEEVRTMTKKRDWTRTLWLQKHGWGPGWSVAVFFGLAGDEWWLLETLTGDANRVQRFQTQLPMNKGYPDLSHEFWQNLTVLTTGMIAQSVDLRELHRRHIRNCTTEASSWAVASVVRIPAVSIELSALFPSIVSTPEGEVKPSAAESRVHDKLFTSDATRVRRPVTTMALGSEASWAVNVISIGFKEVNAPVRLQDETNEGNNQDHRLVCVSVATVKVQKRHQRKLEQLKGEIGQDVAYYPEAGEFHMKIRHAVGESTLSMVKDRVMAIDRFVSFLEAMDQAKGTIVRDTANLHEVSCFYGQPGSSDEKIGDGQESTSRPPWKLVLDLSKPDIEVKLEKNNPHLKLTDLMQRLVNLSGGIKGLLAWLPNSLPAISAIDKIEASWQEPGADAKGGVRFTPRALDCFGINYTLYGPEGNRDHGARQLSLVCKVRPRNTEVWWELCRQDGVVEDSFSQALKSIWEGKGQGWQGLQTGAAGTGNDGVAHMLESLDEAIRTLAGTTEGDGSLTTTQTLTQGSDVKPPI